MKYYYNQEKDILLIDENDYTPYLKDRGYHEITKQEYDVINEIHREKFKDIEEPDNEEGILND